MNERARLQAAIGYAAARHRVLPLLGKRPPFSDWPKRASSDRQTILTWWAYWPDANVGLLCGDGLLVLDVDGEAARRELETLQARCGRLPETAVVATGRDGYGRHLYFRAPPGARSWLLWRDNESLGRLEVKALGCQVVAPPSVHPDTEREYVWLERSRLAQAPSWLLARRQARARRASTLSSSDPLHRISATEYVPLLTGRELGRDSKVRCPLHASGRERTPSLHAYDGDGGWYCYGCRRGGTIIDLAAALWGYGTRGADYCELREKLIDVMLGEGVVA